MPEVLGRQVRPRMAGPAGSGSGSFRCRGVPFFKVEGSSDICGPNHQNSSMERAKFRMSTRNFCTFVDFCPLVWAKIQQNHLCVLFKPLVEYRISSIRF